MSTSPSTPDGRRPREDALIRSARRMTAQHGLDGFSIQQLCADAGVDLGEFSTSFWSKEHAVIGARSEGGAIAATLRFLTGGDGLANDLDPHLLDAMTEMSVERWSALGIDAASMQDLSAALQREPRLYGVLADLIAEREQFDVRVIVQREDLATDDPRAEVASLILGRLVLRSALDALDAQNDEPFAEILRRRVDAAHALFATQAPSRTTTGNEGPQ